MEDQSHRAQEDLIKMERDRERERDAADRPNRDPYPSNPPHHSNASSIPIHQPVANRYAGTIHSPGGLLSAQGNASSHIPLGAPSGPAPALGGGSGAPIHNNEPNRQPVPHGAPNGASNSQHAMFGPAPHTTMHPNGNTGASGAGGPAVFGPPLQAEGGRGPPPQPMPFGGGMPAGNAMGPAPNAMNQGQQPILNVSDCKAQGLLLENRVLIIVCVKIGRS